MTEPINSEFAAVTLAAVAACRAFIADRATDLGYVSRKEVPEYAVNAAGWPATVSSTVGSSSKQGPWDWGLLFASNKKGFAKFDPTDVPELAAVIAYVESQPGLADRLSPYNIVSPGDDLRAELLRSDAVRWVTRLIQRAEALGATEDPQVLQLYLDIERGLLADTLRGDLLFPIPLVNFEIDSRFEVGAGVAIEPLDEATQRARAPYVFGSPRVNPYLAAAATHAIVVEDQEFSNDRGPHVRSVVLQTQPLDTSAVERVCQAIYILTGIETGFAQICLRPRGWADEWIHDLPPIDRLQTVERFPARLADTGWNKTHPTVKSDSIAQLPAVFALLDGSDHKRAQLAARRLFQTSLRDLDDDIVIDACIGIEALVGEERDELTHRMALRTAAALAGQGWSPSIAYDTLKKVYAYRSKLVHGAVISNPNIKVGKDASDLAASGVAVYVLRQLLVSFVTSPGPWTPATLDAQILAGLQQDAPPSNDEIPKGEA